MRPLTSLTTTTAALALAAAMSIAAGALEEGCYVALAGDPATTDDDVTACEEQHYFHRATTHASNAGYVAAPHGLPTFDATPPAGSVSGGNGGGFVIWSTPLVGGDDALVDARFSGTFNGTLDRLDVDLHTLYESYRPLDTLVPIPQSLDVDVMINGSTIFSATELEVTPVPEEASAADSMRLDFAITGLAALLEGFNFANGPDAVHEITLVVGAGFLDQVTIIAFDTTEVPGGIGFNRVDIPDGTVIVSAS